MNPIKLLTLGALGTLALALGACATQPTPAGDKVAEQEQCIRETGTRIEREQGKCQNVPGHAYSREDIERTGGVRTSDALKRLGVR